MSTCGETFCICKCYFTNNYYSRLTGRHFRFFNRTRFITDYKKYLDESHEVKTELLLNELEEEQRRRFLLSEESRQRTQRISQEYVPLHHDVYTLRDEHLASEFLDLVNYSRSNTVTVSGLIEKMNTWKAERVYSFPVFTPDFCRRLLEELDNFLSSNLPVGKPNTMNEYGILLNELGFDRGFITPLRERYIQPMSALLFPELAGTELDSHKAFTVQYELDGDTSLDFHYDNAEVTLNVCLGKGFDDGMLYFGRMRRESQTEADWSEVNHTVSHGVLHRGQHMHGAMPVQDGIRVNLIVWCRSSKVRNDLCPMCDSKPDLSDGHGFGDGFTRDNVNVCSVI